MDPNSDRCATCGKAKTSTKGATITQWISLCQCDALIHANPEDAENAEWCQTCGKKMESKRQGSMTQWIFRENSCRCEFPQVAISSASPSAPHSVVARRIKDPSVSKGIQIDLEVQPEFEPPNSNKTSGVLKTVAIIAVFIAALTAASLGFVMLNEKKVDAPPVETSFSSMKPVDMYLAERPPSEVFGTIGLVTNGTEVIEVKRFMPAENAGIAAGDIIISIDELTNKGQSTDEVLKRLSGSCGTTVHLRVLRNGRELEFNVERTEDIYERFPDILTPGQYLKLGIEEKFAGRYNRSRLALTLAEERGQGPVKEQAAQEIRSELPKNYVPFGAQKLNNEAHNLLVAAAYKSLLVQSRDCIERYPNFEPPYIGLAQFYVLDDKPEKALELLDKVTSMNANFTDAWILRSMVTHLRDDQTASEDALSKAAAANPKGYRARREDMDKIMEVFAMSYKNSSYVNEFKRQAERHSRKQRKQQ